MIIIMKLHCQCRHFLLGQKEMPIPMNFKQPFVQLSQAKGGNSKEQKASLYEAVEICNSYLQ